MLPKSVHADGPGIDAASHEVQQLSRAEMILDRTLAYQAAQAVHELKDALDIDIAAINLTVTPMPGTPGAYRVSCAILKLDDRPPLKVQLVVSPPAI